MEYLPRENHNERWWGEAGPDLQSSPRAKAAAFFQHLRRGNVGSLQAWETPGHWFPLPSDVVRAQRRGWARGRNEFERFQLCGWSLKKSFRIVKVFYFKTTKKKCRARPVCTREKATQLDLSVSSSREKRERSVRWCLLPQAGGTTDCLKNLLEGSRSEIGCKKTFLNTLGCHPIYIHQVCLTSLYFWRTIRACSPHKLRRSASVKGAASPKRRTWIVAHSNFFKEVAALGQAPVLGQRESRDPGHAAGSLANRSADACGGGADERLSFCGSADGARRSRVVSDGILRIPSCTATRGASQLFQHAPRHLSRHLYHLDAVVAPLQWGLLQLLSDTAPQPRRACTLRSAS